MAIRLIKTGAYAVKFYLNGKEIAPEDLKVFKNLWSYIKLLFNKKKDVLTIRVLNGTSVIVKLEVDL